MKRIFAVILTTVLLLTACTSSGEIESSSSAVESSEPEIEEQLSLDVDLFSEGEELSGTLVISSDTASTYAYGYNGIYPLVEGFNELHPDVEIVVEGYDRVDTTRSDEEIAIEREQYKQNMRINLTAGNAPDLIFSRENYTASFALTNNIMNLNAFMQNDPTFIKENYFTQVLEAAEVDGKLYNMPNTINITLMRLQEDVLKVAGFDPNSIETVDYKFLLDVYTEAMESGRFPDLKFIGREGREGNALLHRYEITNAFNSNELTANFNTPEFIEYLKLTKEYPVDENTFGSFYPVVYDGDEGFIDDTYFAQVNEKFMICFDAAKFVIDDIEGVTKSIPIVTSKGEVPVRTNYNMSIPTNAKNPALAWEFIKYCIYESDEMPIGLEISKLGKWNGDRFDMEIPINKNNFKNFVNAQLEKQTQEEKDKMISLYENALSLPIVTMNYDAYLPAYENDILREYYETDGLYTAEEVAEILQEQTEIYLEEIE